MMGFRKDHVATTRVKVQFKVRKPVSCGNGIVKPFQKGLPCSFQNCFAHGLNKNIVGEINLCLRTANTEKYYR